jgi:DNA-binding NarL/FixJ family response regulator
LNVIGETNTAAQAYALVQRHYPHIAIVTLGFSADDSVVIRKLVKDLGVHVLVLADLDDQIVTVLQAGASGILLKDADVTELIHAVRVIANGEAMLSPVVTRWLLDRIASRLSVVSLLPKELTNRELDVLKLVAGGLSNDEIALALCLATSSIKTHIGRLLAKCKVRDRSQLVMLAYECGLIGCANL